MIEIIIALIIFQAMAIALGYFGLARQIHSTKKRLSVLVGMVSILPLLFALIYLVANQPITTDSFVGFFLMYLGTVVASSVTTGIVELIENLLNKR
ncbi:MAG: hypothetical protein KJ771_07560 [Nanoarchaeota archaeon]|nr:hypothetical protein [Nanoarchaeota archaeon]